MKRRIKERNPWISISDLLSSVVLVVLLLFVMASIAPRYSLETQKNQMMNQIRNALDDYATKGQIRIHAEQGMLEFTSVTFSSGSAELSSALNPIVKEIAEKLRKYMQENRMMEVLIEGHTDPAKVSKVVNRGGYYATNIQLSTLRAANVRDKLLSYMGNEFAERIGVAGYGETRLKNKKDPLSPENRRIEIRILWNGKEQK